MTSYDGNRRRIRYRYRRPPNREDSFLATLVEAGPRTLIMAAPLLPTRPVAVSGEVVVKPGDLAVWFLFQGQPFDVARVYSAEGVFHGYYADALEPVSWTGVEPPLLAPLVDLFVDLWIWPDLRAAILDENELAEAEHAGCITALQAGSARSTIHRLYAETEAGRFPPSPVVDYLLSASEVRTLAAVG